MFRIQARHGPEIALQFSWRSERVRNQHRLWAHLSASSPRLAWFPSSETARRGFCPTCGSNLFWDGPGTHLSIVAGTLDAPTGISLAGHIFVADKGDYYDVADDLPQADGADPALTTQVSAHETTGKA